MELGFVVDLSLVDSQKRLILKNVSSVVWFAVLVAHFGYSAFSGNEKDAHLWGDMFAGMGPARMCSISGVIIFSQCILYRSTVIKLTMEGHVMVTSTISGILKERNRVLRQQKIRMTRIILVIAIAATAMFAVSAVFLLSGMLFLQLMWSQSLFETICWILWSLFDMVSMLPLSTTIILFAAMWIMMAFNYRMDLCELMRQVENVGEADSLEQEVVTINSVCNWYDHVVDEAVAFHRFSSLMLMSLSLCTKPYFVSSLFVLNNDENPFLTITLFVVIIPPVLFGWFLLAVAATTTSMSEKLHVLLCSLAARDARDQSFFRHQRYRLQLMIEEVGSEETFFALRTPDGQKYTPETLLFYLIETVLDYTLLVTFDRFMKLSST